MDGWGPGLCYHPIKVKSGHATTMVHQAHIWGSNTPHLFSESIQSLGYCLLSFCFNSISPNLCVWEREVPGACTPHLDDLRRWFSGLWFGFDQHPKKAGACLISAKLEHLSFFCFFFFLSPRANWISAASPWFSTAAILQNSDTVMQYVYPFHRIAIFNIN